VSANLVGAAAFVISHGNWKRRQIIV
jgi:hypothetical protein